MDSCFGFEVTPSNGTQYMMVNNEYEIVIADHLLVSLLTDLHMVSITIEAHETCAGGAGTNECAEVAHTSTMETLSLKWPNTSPSSNIMARHNDTIFVIDAICPSFKHIR
jgi:hypothetical protein